MARLLLIEDDTRLADMVREYLTVRRLSRHARADRRHGPGRTRARCIRRDRPRPHAARRRRARGVPPRARTRRDADPHADRARRRHGPRRRPRARRRRLPAQALRAARAAGPPPGGPAPRGARARADVLRFGRLEIDLGARKVRVDGEPATSPAPVRPAGRAGRAGRPRAVARAAHGPRSRATRSRPSTARSTCTSRASARRSRTIPSAAARPHGARRRLRLREAGRTERTRSMRGSTCASISRWSQPRRCSRSSPARSGSAVGDAAAAQAFEVPGASSPQIALPAGDAPRRAAGRARASSGGPPARSTSRCSQPTPRDRGRRAAAAAAAPRRAPRGGRKARTADAGRSPARRPLARRARPAAPASPPSRRWFIVLSLGAARALRGGGAPTRWCGA